MFPIINAAESLYGLWERTTGHRIVFEANGLVTLVSNHHCQTGHYTVEKEVLTITWPSATIMTDDSSLADNQSIVVKTGFKLKHGIFYSKSLNNQYGWRAVFDQDPLGITRNDGDSKTEEPTPYYSQLLIMT